ncbi:hypothetical protein RJ641_003691 [Dillenia turbinata]|uniref:Uncharacterized protein n=1 Tax=Dillenia turbinata TaxID=194707 RepID=A0AAN8Z9F0_9MAGN
MSRRLEELSCNRASPACISFPSSESLLIQSSKMIWSSGYVRSTALLPETTSKTTIPKLKTSDFAVAKLLFWKLSGVFCRGFGLACSHKPRAVHHHAYTILSALQDSGAGD